MSSAIDLDRTTIADALDVMAHGRPSSARSRAVRTYAAGRVTYDLGAREVYSYGRHFPLLRYVPRGRRRPLIVLNGDVWRNGGGRSRTADHQSIARELSAAIADTCVIPFSALDGAGINPDTVRPLETRADEQWRETMRERDPDRVPQWVRRGGSDYVSARAGGTADGAAIEWSWSEWRHRLGDCLFTAERTETYLRPARPFEQSRETGRVTVDVAWRETYCNVAPSGAHVTGPAGACIHCTRPLQARVSVRRRGLYLSSFDYQESPPLYFLAEVPRASRARTVEHALEALAPRAVHAARARGIDVRRQGDVFFIRTALDLEALEARGLASRARLTQWTRDARARKGETGYKRPLSARERRSMARYRRAEWRRIFRDAETKISAPRPAVVLEARDARRRERAAAWRELGPGADRRALDDYRRGRPAPLILPGPQSAAGARREWAKRRARHAADLASARAVLRAATFGGARPRHRGYGAMDRYSEVQRYTRLTPLQYERRGIAERVQAARARVAELEARAPGIAAGRAIARDAYRAPYKYPIAAAAWSMAGAGAWRRFYPAEHDGATIARRRETVRRALAIYGTSHSATEVLRTRAGAVYVRGTVRHVPDLEPGRAGGRDHAPLDLGADGALWLAVRNAVPRQRVRRSA